MRKLDSKQKEKLHQKLLELKKFPDLSNIKKLTNFEPTYRLRVGDYRILFDVVDSIIEIGRVLHRKESCKQKQQLANALDQKPLCGSEQVIFTFALANDHGGSPIEKITYQKLI